MTRRILWYAVAYTIVIIVHEGAHAIVAGTFNLEPTLYHFWVDFDPDRATAWQRAAVGFAGPLSSLVIGVVAWLAYRRRPAGAAAAMPLLLLAACGVSNFFGNMTSTAFVGDFSNAARWLDLPMAVRYVLSATGAVVTATVLFFTGRELMRCSSPQGSRLAATLDAVVMPIVIGTAIIIVINQPNPIPGFAAARAGEAAFWVFGVAGALTAVRSSTQDVSRLGLHWTDSAVAALVLVVVRIMAIGLPLNG